ncbi:caspase family protein [Pseudomonas syringae]|uniref:caspase family protein n=1 Tax=Pseudomonas TaxID=286 RepID=UPI000CD3205B|nr:caspase family protein [Pseudomonas syringae]MCF5031545.1 caspase family protein [Pseudomonas syringae]POD22486.1 peptidase C14 [Pseudomonas syringae pv. syringae]UQB21413.1 caspase family protein [Pseudomonas syringae pv. syringae]
MRKALIVGIDYYDHIGGLSGCVNDAHSVKSILERHADNTVNFTTPRLMTSSSASNPVSRRELKDAVKELFSDDSDIALFYFAGHGYIEETGGYLCATDTRDGDDGLALAEVMTLANSSPAKNKVIILDSCHGGIAATNPNATFAEIKDGITILTASTATQYAMETPGGGAGVFTTLLVDALGGAAANLLGDVTPGSVYAHVDQSLGPWGGQRPVFKTNVKSFVSLRTAAPPIALGDLQALTKLFPRQDYDFPLDPSYEPERTDAQKSDPSMPQPDLPKNTVFALLQRLVKVNLVRPKGEAHMWHAAMNSKSCELTVLGQHYWMLVKQELI